MCCHTMTPYPYTPCQLWPKSFNLFLCSWAFDTLCWFCIMSVYLSIIFTFLFILLCVNLTVVPLLSIHHTPLSRILLVLSFYPFSFKVWWFDHTFDGVPKSLVRGSLRGSANWTQARPPHSVLISHHHWWWGSFLFVLVLPPSGERTNPLPSLWTVFYSESSASKIKSVRFSSPIFYSGVCVSIIFHILIFSVKSYVLFSSGHFPIVISY